MAQRRPLPLPSASVSLLEGWRGPLGRKHEQQDSNLQDTTWDPLWGGQSARCEGWGDGTLLTTGRGEALTRTNPSRKPQDLQSLQVQCLLGTLGTGHLVDPEAPGSAIWALPAARSPSRASAHPPSFPRAAPRGCWGQVSVSPLPLVLQTLVPTEGGGGQRHRDDARARKLYTES